MKPSQQPEIILITDMDRYDEQATLKAAEAWCRHVAAGRLMIQLRDKECSARRRLRLGRALREVTQRHGQALVVNDRADLALLLRADGIHLGEAGIEVGEARSLLGAHAWISRACHCPEQVTEMGAANAVLLSPILAARKGRQPLGVGALTTARDLMDRAVVDGAARAAPMALYALGGVDLGARDRCVRAGASGIAMIGAAWGEPPAVS